ncbi:MAG: hypothetical protein ACK5NT_10240 [Pyrinomonadaceae bacterium]
MSEVSFCPTLSIDVNEFEYETISNENGNSTVIKFEINTDEYSPGDAIVVLDGDEIVFHGMIGKIEDGFAWASDPRGSLLPATVQ